MYKCIHACRHGLQQPHRVSQECSYTVANALPTLHANAWHKHIHAPPHQPPTTPGVRRYAFNLFSHNSPMTENGYNEEEMKMVKETRKIWNCPGVQVGRTVGYMWV